MNINNSPKFIILLVSTIGLVLLMAIGRMKIEDGKTLLAAIVFYGVGNGIAAVKGSQSTPPFSPSPKAIKARARRKAQP